jgi:hypothetical protein
MKNINLGSALLLSMLLLMACDKNDGIKTAQMKPDNTAQQNPTAVFLTEAKTNMQKILSPNDFDGLDWNNAVVRKSTNEETMVLVKNLTTDKSPLIYVTSSNLVLYQWNTEVHIIVKSEKNGTVK